MVSGNSSVGVDTGRIGGSANRYLIPSIGSDLFFADRWVRAVRGAGSQL